MTTQKVRPLSIAIAALGGQGGGVLAQWIVDMAEANGYLAQSTSVPGVAQRTGATIYYLELFPEAEVKKSGKAPVLALMPVPGDVEICIASELAEAGRSIMRGYVSPGLTTLITSSHRVYAIAEKEMPGDGRVEFQKISDAAQKASKKLVMFDMDAAAEKTSSVISAVLFGALAGSGALPFPRQAFEDTIKHTGKAVSANLAGFTRGFDEAEGRHTVEAAEEIKTAHVNSALVARIATLPTPSRQVIREGVRRLVEYQDKAYANLYLDRLAPFAAIHDPDDQNFLLLTETARWLALWMGFEDVIRVAELKTRVGRMDEIGQEVRAANGQPFDVIEFFHPRFDEFCDTLPAFIGGRLAASKHLQKWLAPFFAEGRNLTTTRLSGFLPLYMLASLKGLRRSSLRYKRENADIERWLDEVLTAAKTRYDLAVELAQCPRLIKGYGSTHARGNGRFRQIMDSLPALLTHDNAAAQVRAMRDEALASEDPARFENALARAR